MKFETQIFICLPILIEIKISKSGGVGVPPPPTKKVKLFIYYVILLKFETFAYIY